jgi:hypothetical protein
MLMHVTLKYVGPGLTVSIVVKVDVSTTGEQIGILYNYFNTLIDNLTVPDRENGLTIAKGIYRLVKEKDSGFKIETITTELKFDNGVVALEFDRNDFAK